MPTKHGQRPNPGFRFIDLFAGIGGIRKGFEAIEGQCVWTSEWNKFSQETYRANFGGKDGHEIAGDITQVAAEEVPDHDVLLGGFPCFVAGTPIRTREGWTPIEALRKGDGVITGEGRLRPVNAVMRKDSAPTREVEIFGCLPLICTDEHPFLARRFKRLSGGLSVESPEWVAARDLNLDTYVKLPKDLERPAALEALPETCRTLEFWKTVGHRFGEWLDDHQDEADDAEIPESVFVLPSALQAAMWDGWLMAYGKIERDGTERGRVLGRRPATGLSRLARNAFGRMPALRQLHSEAQADAPPVMELSLAPSSHSAFDADGAVWTRVVSNGLTGKLETVWNIGVEEDETYVAGDAVVHNCQPFSIAGVSKKNSLGREHGFACKSQGTLFFDVARILHIKRPVAFLLENVKNLKAHDKGNTFRVILDVLENDLGYEVHHRIINAKHFVPQNRERIFIVGFRKPTSFDFDALDLPDLATAPRLSAILHPEDGSEGEAGRPYTMGPEGRVADKYVLTDKLWTYLQAYAAKHKAAGNGFGFGLVGPEDTARTLSARYHKDGSEILVDRAGREGNPPFRPGTPRRLTPRECARLQGYPDDFAIPVSDTQAYRQFGNSVAVPVIEAIARHMAPHIAELLAGKGKKAV